MGFKVVYKDNWGELICQRIVEGKLMKDIAEELGVAVSTIYTWESENVRGFRDNLREARRQSAYALVDECLSIADDCPLNSVSVARAALRIKTRMQIVNRLQPEPIAAPKTPLMEEPDNQMDPADFIKKFNLKHTPVTKEIN